MKKTTALILAVVLLLSLGLSGCSQTAHLVFSTGGTTGVYTYSAARSPLSGPTM